MKHPLDKKAIARNFSQAAADYDRSAEAQRRIAEALAAMLPCPSDLPRGGVLELGCGTGLLTRHLAARYPNRPMLGLDLAPGMIEFCRRQWPADDRRVQFEAADVEAPELIGSIARRGPWAMVASSCTFQWLRHPDGVLARAREWLEPGGMLALGTMLEGSLGELADSYAAAQGEPMPALDLWSPRRFRGALASAGFRMHSDSLIDEIAVVYPDPLDVMRSLREIGATFHRQPGYRPLGGGAMRRLAQVYRERHGDGQGNVRATYRAYLILAERGR